MRSHERKKTMNQHGSSNEQTFHIHVASSAETGRFLEHNDDAFVLYDLSNPEKAVKLGKLYVLADGNGEYGAEASSIAVETIPTAYYNQSESDSPLLRLQQAFYAANSRIHKLSITHQQEADMSASCTAVVVRGECLWIGHIGDSRAYLVHPATREQPAIERLTTDHSRVAAQVRSGDLPPEHMRLSSNDRDVLLKALGKSEDENASPDIIIQGIHSGDVLVLCSDGLWSVLSQERLARVVREYPPQQACDELVRLANEIGGDENISVVLLSFS
ncbi:MAG: hypothetical protein NVSMB49_21300 [Ktedonobacteraceae bacterium]